MEMCYDGALVMPSSYAVMYEDEMTYVEGGKYYGVNWSAKDCKKLAEGLNTHSAIIGTYATVLGLISLIPGVNAFTGSVSDGTLWEGQTAL